MGRYEQLHLTFDPPISEETFKALKAALKDADYDAPVDDLDIGGVIKSDSRPPLSRECRHEEWFCHWRKPPWDMNIQSILEAHHVNGHGWMRERINDHLPIDDNMRFTFGTAPEMRARIDRAKELRDAKMNVYDAKEAVIAAARAQDSRERPGGQDVHWWVRQRKADHETLIAAATSLRSADAALLDLRASQTQKE